MFVSNWHSILDDVNVNYKGIYDEKAKSLVTNTLPFFQKIIDIFGLSDEIELVVTPDREILMLGSVIKGPFPNPRKAGETVLIRHEKFIRAIESVKLSWIIIKYKPKRKDISNT